MTPREVGLSVAAGLAILVLSAAFPVLRGSVAIASNLWFVGLAAVIAAFVLGLSGRAPAATKVLGLIGIAWVTMIVAAIGVVLFLLLTTGGH